MLPGLPVYPSSCCYLSHFTCLCRWRAVHAREQCNKRAQSTLVLTNFSHFPVQRWKKSEKPGPKERSALSSVFFRNNGKSDPKVRTLPLQGSEWVICGYSTLRSGSVSAILVRKVAFCYRCPETRGETLRLAAVSGRFSVPSRSLRARSGQQEYPAFMRRAGGLH